MNIPADSNNNKKILVLARNNALEAMRVAAGLTIVGHEISLVFMHRELTEAEASSEQAELLELCDIIPKTTVDSMGQHFTVLTPGSLGTAIKNAEVVINL